MRHEIPPLLDGGPRASTRSCATRITRGDFVCWQEAAAYFAAVDAAAMSASCRANAGAWLADERPWALFWTQTFRPRLRAVYGMSLEFCRARWFGLLDQAARDVGGLSRSEVRRGAVYGWTSWELTKADNWHAHALLCGLQAKDWRAYKEFAFARDGIARIYPIEPGEETMACAVYVSKYVAKGPDEFDVVGDWHNLLDGDTRSTGARPWVRGLEPVDTGESRPR